MVKLDKELFKKDIEEYLKNFYRKTIEEADKRQRFMSVACALKVIVFE